MHSCLGHWCQQTGNACVYCLENLRNLRKALKKRHISIRFYLDIIMYIAVNDAIEVDEEKYIKKNVCS